MSKRTRIHPVQFYLNDDEQYILEEKYRLSRMKSKSAFLRKMILYGFVYEVDYSHIRKMNTLLGNISNNLNQITDEPCLISLFTKSQIRIILSEK